MNTSRPSLDPLLAPSSIALVGASLKEGSYGLALLEMLYGGGFGGPIHAVNPGYVGTRDDRPFHASMADLPEAPDHTVIAVGTSRVEEALADAIAAGTKAATIFADIRDHAMKDRLGDMARKAGIALVGPNSMGLHNLDIRMRITPFPVPLDLTPGGIALIAQSGSVLGALVNNDRRFRFNTVISTGSEAVTTAADYLAWALDQRSTRVVGLFLETVRDPEGFLAALDHAAAKDIPVVILKVGRSEASARMAISHTGAIVGNHQVFRTVTESRGAHLVETVDEMAALLQVFNQGRRAGGDAPGRGIATIHDSGGERELIADLAEDCGVPFAQLSDQTLTAIDAVLEPGMEADNPLDAWGTGHGADAIFTASFRAMLDDDAVAAGLYMLDWRENYYLHAMHERILTEIAATTDKPVIAASNFALTNNREMASRMADNNIPLIESSREAMVAMKHLLAHGRKKLHACDHHPHPEAQSWRQRIMDAPMTEDVSMALLSAYGITTPGYAVVETAADAVRAARQIGLPVVLKTLADGIHHKTEAGGVKINLETEAAVTAAWEDLAERLSTRVLVAGMVPSGVEMALGAVNDSDFGAAVMIAPGGIGVEMFDDRLILMPPFSPETVLERLPEMKIYRLLSGYRGKPALAIESFARMAARFSHLVHDLSGVIETMDINPVIVHETAAVAVDALVIGQPGR